MFREYALHERMAPSHTAMKALNYFQTWFWENLSYISDGHDYSTQLFI